MQAEAMGRDVQENHGEHVVQIATKQEYVRENGMLVHGEQLPDNDIYDVQHDCRALAFSLGASTEADTRRLTTLTCWARTHRNTIPSAKHMGQCSNYTC